MDLLKVKWIKFCYSLARIAKSINAISRAVKLSATLILALLIFAGVYWSSLVIIPVMACIGGVFCFFGLLIEDEAAKEEKKLTPEVFIADPLIAKSKGRLGWWILMFGIFIEIATGAGLAAFDVYENKITKDAIDKVDLNKQPIFAIAGHAMVLAMPLELENDFLDKKLETNNFPPAYFKVKYPDKGNADVATIFFGRSTEMANATDIDEASISSDNVSESISTFGGRELLRFDIWFGESQNSFSKSSMTPEMFNAINLLLPTHCVVVGGHAEINIDHDFIKREFEIPEQPYFGESASSVATNGKFVSLNWSAAIRDGFEKEEYVRIGKAQAEASFLAHGVELEAKANSDKKERTISDDQKKLFIDLLRNYPKLPIKVFVNSNDVEAVSYAKKIRRLLDEAKYGEEAGGFIENSSSILIGTNQIPWQPSSNMLAFVAFPAPVFPVSIPFNDFKPVISSGLTNDAAIYGLGNLWCVRWAFTGIGVTSIYFYDTNGLKAGEVGIIVPPKPK